MTSRALDTRAPPSAQPLPRDRGHNGKGGLPITGVARDALVKARRLLSGSFVPKERAVAAVGLIDQALAETDLNCWLRLCEEDGETPRAPDAVREVWRRMDVLDAVTDGFERHAKELDPTGRLSAYTKSAREAFEHVRGWQDDLLAPRLRP